MNRRRRIAWSSSALVAVSLVAITTASAVQFVPALQAQNPPAVNGSTTTATPNVAVVVGHTGSMMEDLSTGRVGFSAADFNEAVPATACSGAACACTGGASGSSYAASPTLFNPALFRLYCGDSALAEPAEGVGPLLTDVKNVNVFDDTTGTQFDQYQSFMARLYPDIDFVGSGCASSSCSVGTGQQFVGTTYGEGTDYTGPDYAGGVSPADICARAGTACELLTPPGTGDGVEDRAVYPWDSDTTYQLNARFNYQPTSGGGAPFKRIGGDFPYLDPITGFNFNHPVRMQDPGTTSTRWRNSKLRSSMCAVEGFLGLNRYRTLADGSVLNCALDDLGDSTSDDANADGYDDFYEQNVKGKASVALFKTYQISPGLYPPFDNDSDFTENRLRVDLRVANFYGPGSTDTLGASFGCGANGDEPCNRSVALLEPDVNRNFGDTNRWHECMGLGRNNSSGTPFQSSIGDDNATIRAAIDSRYGVPGGVMSLSGILRDACGTNGNCPGASTTLPNSVASSGIFSADTNACGSSNALVIVTDSPDSCADISCSTAVGERLPGYADSPSQPFPSNATASKTCPDNIAAAMRASSTEAKTYIIGLDADWDTSVKRSVAAVAAAGGTNSYYPARSFDDVENALRGIFNDVKNSGDAVIPAGVFALGIARSDSTNLKDVVIDARYKPQNWQGYLFAREITQSGQPLAFWEAGSLLAARDLSVVSQARNTFTTLDLNCDGRISGADERALFGTSNLDLTTAGGPFATQASCTGTPRTSLKNVHNTGAPFFLDAQVNVAQGWSNRDGNAFALIDYTIGLTPAQITADTNAVAPATTYRSRDFDGDGTAGNSVWRLYDSVNSSPVIVGPSFSIQANDADADGDGLTDFDEYQAWVLDRPRAAYVGTNGGSLHAFNVDGDTSIRVNGSVVNSAGAKAGGELFAVWPHEMLTRLKRYANASYGTTDGLGNRIHEDGLDLTARIFDAKIYPNSEGAPLFGWRTVLVIGDRNGGHGYMALDVTDPAESMGLQDKDSSGALVAYTYPTLLWEFDEFADEGHTITGDPLEADARCDEDDDSSPGTPDLTERSRFADCEDNGQDDNWQDRLGRSWSTPFVTRARTTDGNPVMFVLSGPGTIEPGGSPPGTATSGAGYVLAIDVGSGSLIDLDGATSNGLPLKVSDSAITSGPNAGPVCVGGTGVSCTGGQFVAPFRSSIAGGDITTSDDATYSGQRADVLYWGDLGGRLWRGRFTAASSNDLETKVLFFPDADTSTVDTAHPIVSRPSLTPARTQTLLGSSPPLLVVWGDGSLAFGPTDVAEGIYPVDETGSDEKFRIFSVVDDAVNGTAQYLDFSDETNCDDGANATASTGDDPGTNSGGDLDNRTTPSTTYPAVTGIQDPASGTHPPTTSGGYYQCLKNNAGTGIAGATGSERILGSPAILGGAVIVETLRPVSPISNVCYNVGTGSILAFDYSTAGIINFTLKGGVTSNGGGKYFTAPENPVAVANTAGYKALGAPPDGFPPDFLRYHVVTGAEAPAPQIPIETIYWREPF